MKTVNLKSINITFAFIAVALVVWFVYVFFAGVEPFSVMAVAMAGTVLSDAKGANKIKGKGYPCQVIERQTKSNKPAYLLLFDKNERGQKAIEEVDELFNASRLFFWSWPTANPDKEKFIAKGVNANPSTLHILENYKKMTYLDAKEVGAKAKAERQAEKQAKKDAKKTDKSNASGTLAKIAAIEKMEGLTPLERATLIAQLA